LDSQRIMRRVYGQEIIDGLQDHID
jgi:hypothetical protein